MNELKMIDQRIILEKNLRIYGDFENPLFLAKDIAEWIEYDTEKVNEMVAMADDNEKLTETISWSGQRRKMWFLKEDGLYEVLMQSRKPIAKEFKKKVKEILKSIRQNGGYIAGQENLTDAELMAKAILVAQKTIENKNSIIEYQQKKIEEQAPKVELAEAIAGSETSILIRDMAKILNQNGVDIGEKKFFKWLREKKYLISQKGESYNTPSQTSMNLKIMEIKENIYHDSNGEQQISKTPVVTGKGQQYFINKFLRDKKEYLIISYVNERSDLYE